MIQRATINHLLRVWPWLQRIIRRCSRLFSLDRQAPWRSRGLRRNDIDCEESRFRLRKRTGSSEENIFLVMIELI
jgi:hypothetical protein